LGKKGGRNKLKSIAAPRSWDISRKGDRFVYKPTPGPYPIAASYPLGVVIRNLAGMATRSKEVKFIARSGKVLIDGTERHAPSFPVGLFNIVSVPVEGIDYRLVPSRKGLALAKIGADERNKKLCSVSTKTKVRGGHFQYGLHDGRSVLADSLNLSPGDAVLLEVPSQKILGQVKLAKGSVGLILSGVRTGQTGEIAEVKKGTISRERMVRISLPGGDTEIPSRLVFPVGTDRPMTTIGVAPR
jgi:small subunit ribosomal protein S4e